MKRGFQYKKSAETTGKDTPFVRWLQGPNTLEWEQQQAAEGDAPRSRVDVLREGLGSCCCNECLDRLHEGDTNAFCRPGQTHPC